MKRTGFKPKPYTWKRRTPIKRQPPRVPQSDPDIFEIVTDAGDRYLWPVKHMPEVGPHGWQATIEGWALAGDPKTKLWHAETSEATRSKGGWFDLAIFQPTRRIALFVELKVRDRDGEASSQPSKKQWEYISAAVASGLDVRVWYWPDHGREAWETLIDGQEYHP